MQSAVTVACVGKTRLNVLCGKIRKIFQYLGDGHPAAEIVENIRHGDPSATNAGFATSRSWIKHDELPVIHIRKVGSRPSGVKTWSRSVVLRIRKRISAPSQCHERVAGAVCLMVVVEWIIPP